MTCIWVLALAAASTLTGLHAAEGPYFITYGHHMEEPGSLEFADHEVIGSPKGGNPFVNHLIEMEYGINGWWTTELYLSGQSTAHESTLFTGWRWENRARLFMREHWINPVLYVEFENLNGADKSLREIVGHDGVGDQIEPNDETRLERKHEIETKLILSSNFRGWNAAGNFIAEKNLKNEPWEFGYAAGISRPLRMAATASPCTLCRENFHTGVEVYGGLGTWHEFGLHDTSHYIAPTLAWSMPSGMRVAVSPSFGLNGNSHDFLMRFSVSYEMHEFARMLRGK